MEAFAPVMEALRGGQPSTYRNFTTAPAGRDVLTA
jgi:hypothetical protein